MWWMESRRIFFGAKDWTDEEGLKDFHLKPARINYRIEYLENRQESFFRFAGQNLGIMDAQSLVPDTIPAHVDLLFFSGPIHEKHFALLKPDRIRQVVITSAVPGHQARRLKKICRQMRIPCHDVNSEGAYQICW